MINDTDQPYGCDLTFRGLRLEVRGNDVGPVTWLDEFVTPQLHEDVATTARCRVEVTVDADRYAAMLATPLSRSAGRHSISCFSLDGHFVSHPLWRDEPEHRVIHDSAAGVFIMFDKAIKDSGAQFRVEILAIQDGRRMRLDVMRVVRELATLHTLKLGDMHVHGAAVIKGGQAFVIAGQKRAGKTSMLLNAMSRPDTTYLSNDRLLLETTREGVLVRGMPTIIKVRSDCLDHLSALPPVGWQQPCLTIEECVRSDPLIETAAHRPGSMSPAQFRRWLGVPASSGVKLAAVVFPRVDPLMKKFEISLLGEAEATRRLADSLFRSGSTGSPPEAFELWRGEEAADRQTMLEKCAAIAMNHPCLDCRLGPQAYAVPNVWDAIAEFSEVQ